MDGILVLRDSLRKLSAQNTGVNYRKPRYTSGQVLSDRDEEFILSLPTDVESQFELQSSAEGYLGQEFFMMDFHGLDETIIR